MPTTYEPPIEPDVPSTPPVLPPYGPPVGTVTPPLVKQPWVVDPQEFATRTLAIDHNQALWTFGEYTMFVLMWNIRDFEAGLVVRCPTCYTSYGKIAETFGQSSNALCPDCYGTTFQGGFRAKVVRPTLIERMDIDDTHSARGDIATSVTTLQTTDDITLHHNDYVLRGDGTRWQFQRPDSTTTYTGFEVDKLIAGWNVGIVVRENESSVAYLIPPDTPTLISQLDVERIRRPLDYSSVEVIRGPL